MTLLIFGLMNGYLGFFAVAVPHHGGRVPLLLPRDVLVADERGVQPVHSHHVRRALTRRPGGRQSVEILHTRLE